MLADLKIPEFDQQPPIEPAQLERQPSFRPSTLAAITFLASVATMAVEIAAGRMIARHLGASIYTWTSVIGIVLAGLAIGNYVGGLVADRKGTRVSVGIILLFAGFACAIIPIADAFAAGWSAIWMFSWPARTAVHVAIAFFFPALSLGLIAPIIVKIALDSGMPRGRAVGGLSAVGTMGSLVGTFAAGFALIEAIGTMGVTSAAGGLLILMSVGLCPSIPRIWIAAVVAMTPIGYIWQKTAFDPSQVSRLAAWRPSAAKPARTILAMESAYSYVEVYGMNETNRMRGMKLDSLVHSEINLDAPHDLQYEYERIFAAITNRLHPGDKAINTITIGGGGYVFPRYLAETRPGGHNWVVEIDPAVTAAAFQGFMVPPGLPIKCFDEDGRVFIDRRGRLKTPVDFDIIYVDALSGYQVPYQLTTVEFIRACDFWMSAKPNRAYLLEMIDIYSTGQFLGSMIKTLREVFSYVYVFAEPLESADWKLYRKPFVVAAFNKPFNNENLGGEYANGYEIVALTGRELDELVSRFGAVVLTDEFAPVENMLAPVVRQAALDRAIMDWLVEINQFEFVGDFAAAVRACDKALRNDWRPLDRAQVLSRKADSLLRLRRFAEAQSAAQEALSFSNNDLPAMKALARAMLAQGNTAEAPTLFERVLTIDATDGCRFDLVLVLQSLGRHEEAAKHCAILVAQEPDIPDGYVRWAVSLEALGQFDQAKVKIAEALKRDPNHAAAKDLKNRMSP